MPPRATMEAAARERGVFRSAVGSELVSSLEQLTDVDPEAELQRLVSLVEASRVDEARTLVLQLAARWPNSSALQRWQEVLALPELRTRSGVTRGSFRREAVWLAAHAHEYPGCWIAVAGDELIAADRSRARVMERVRERDGAERALLFFQPTVPYR